MATQWERWNSLAIFRGQRQMLLRKHSLKSGFGGIKDLTDRTFFFFCSHGIHAAPQAELTLPTWLTEGGKPNLVPAMKSNWGGEKEGIHFCLEKARRLVDLMGGRCAKKTKCKKGDFRAGYVFQKSETQPLPNGCCTKIRVPWAWGSFYF